MGVVLALPINLASLLLCEGSKNKNYAASATTMYVENIPMCYVTSVFSLYYMNANFFS